MQVGGFEDVRVYQGQRADAGTSEIGGDRYAKAAAADDQDFSGAEFGLACGTYFR